MKSKSNSPSFPSPGAIFFGLCACVAFVFLLVALAQNSGRPVKVDIVSLSSEEYQGSVVFTALVEIQSSEDVYITRERHRSNLKNCVEHLKNFQKKKSLEDFDKGAEDLRLATRYLGMLVGKVDVEEVLGSIFNDFCIGK